MVHAECQGHIAVPALPVSGQFTLPVPLELYLGVTEMWQKRSAECVSEAVTQGGPRRSLSATGPASVLSVSYLYDDYGINDNDYGKMIITCTCIMMMAFQQIFTCHIPITPLSKGSLKKRIFYGLLVG